MLKAESYELHKRLNDMVSRCTPQLQERPGVGPDSAAALLITADDNPGRLRPLVSGAFRTPCRRESPGALRVCVWLALLAFRGPGLGGLVRVSASRGEVRRDDAGGAAVR